MSTCLTFAGYNEDDGFQIISLEVSTTMHWKATSYGLASGTIREFLNSNYSENINSEEACELAYEALVRAFGSKALSQLQVATLRKSPSNDHGPVGIEFLSIDDLQRLILENTKLEHSDLDE